MKGIISDETKIESFYFDEIRQTITVIKRMSINQVLLSNPPQSVPDKVWKNVYGVRDGRLCLLETIEGEHVPASINSEKIIFKQ